MFIRYSEFVMPLVKAVQELSDMVDSRQKEIVRLKEAVHKYRQDNLVNEKKSVYGALFKTIPTRSQAVLKSRWSYRKSHAGQRDHLQSGRQTIKKY